jgi:hypothetical protein
VTPCGNQQSIVRELLIVLGNQALLRCIATHNPGAELNMDAMISIPRISFGNELILRDIPGDQFVEPDSVIKGKAFLRDNGYVPVLILFPDVLRRGRTRDPVSDNQILCHPSISSFLSGAILTQFFLTYKAFSHKMLAPLNGVRFDHRWNAGMLE